MPRALNFYYAISVFEDNISNLITKLNMLQYSKNCLGSFGLPPKIAPDAISDYNNIFNTLFQHVPLIDMVENIKV